jgi:mitogen-activated protein kinase kinase
MRSDVWSTGISLLEFVQNRYPFPNDLSPIELMMHITTAEVCYLASNLSTSTQTYIQTPRLEEEPGVQWSDDMKDFIKLTSVN